MGEIAHTLGVAKSSVSYWVRDVALSKSQRKQLNKNSHSVDAIEKRRLSRLANTQKRRNIIMADAMKEVDVFVKNPLWCVGVALYWGEGGKTQTTTRLSNSDPAVITVIMRFFREVCLVPEEKFRGHVHTFAHQNADKAVRYWSEISGIPKNQFFKTYVKKSSASKHKRNTLPNGTLQVYAHDTIVFFRIMGWIEALKNKKLYD